MLRRARGLTAGFCTPGFLISAQALLDQTSSPTEAQVNEAIEGNLCRCTGYQPIVESIMAAAALLRGEAEALRHPPILTPTRIRRVPKNHNCRQGTRGDRSCPEGTVNNPEAPGERFGKTASGWPENSDSRHPERVVPARSAPP